jgi:hypothetical protein
VRSFHFYHHNLFHLFHNLEPAFLRVGLHPWKQVIAMALIWRADVWYHSGSDTPVPKVTDKLLNCHGRALNFRIPEDEYLQQIAFCRWQRMSLYMILLTLCFSRMNTWWTSWLSKNISFLLSSSHETSDSCVMMVTSKFAV